MIKLVKESLNESLKDQLILQIMNTVYKHDDPKNEGTNLAYLRSLPEETLDQMLGDYYTYDVNKQKSNLKRNT